MSLSSSNFSGLSRMASRGLTRSSTPPSCTYCRQRRHSHTAVGTQSWGGETSEHAGALGPHGPPCSRGSAPNPRRPQDALISVTVRKPAIIMADLQ
jgi:hypothetical protein